MKRVMSTHNRRKILLFADWFEPGFKAGGPIRSCVNFVQHMKQDYDLFIFTSDRDLGDNQPYPEIRADQWISYDGHVSIFYASPALLKWNVIRNEMKKVNADFIYLNSMFSTHFSIFPLLIWRLNHLSSAMILSPRGM